MVCADCMGDLTPLSTSVLILSVADCCRPDTQLLDLRSCFTKHDESVVIAVILFVGRPKHIPYLKLAGSWIPTVDAVLDSPKIMTLRG